VHFHIVLRNIGKSTPPKPVFDIFGGIENRRRGIEMLII